LFVDEVLQKNKKQNKTQKQTNKQQKQGELYLAKAQSVEIERPLINICSNALDKEFSF
jgi:K+-sensing histidine kinase KdpD